MGHIIRILKNPSDTPNRGSEGGGSPLTIMSDYEKFDNRPPRRVTLVVGLKGIQKVFIWDEMLN